ncbi:peptidase [Fulvivirga lutimaris]|uniref:peptidase n=1 Tax=Fulvivirga lutimaris TaxID=1819566 RepID=UPI0012BB6AE9|nr:peptidase [Fulvivirga lutimaris]MTI38925.1 peptidase [Fulvivirga lutimaris]
MTYCLGILSREGIVGLADTRITSGSDTTTSKKIYTVERSKHSYFIMTSGLRSVRDKAITYFSEVIESQDNEFDKLYKAVNSFGDMVKRVANEDKKNLEESGVNFNLYAIVGGQLEHDDEPKLYLLYPQGNWIEIGPGTPFVIIGNSGFGSPILKRSITFESNLEFCLKSGFLSFDATRISANDVDYPIDTVVLRKDEFKMREHRFTEKDLGHIADFWNTSLKEAINHMPAEALDKAFKPTEKNRMMIKDAS